VEHLLAFLREHAAEDPKRTEIVDMTPLGLVEITRRRRYGTLDDQIRQLQETAPDAPKSSS